MKCSNKVACNICSEIYLQNVLYRTRCGEKRKNNIIIPQGITDKTFVIHCLQKKHLTFSSYIK